jgi:spermidine synthase
MMALRTSTNLGACTLTISPRIVLSLFITGLVTLLGQVVLLRELLVASSGVELAAVLALGFLLLGGALGSYTARWTGSSVGGSGGGLFLSYSMVIPLAVVFLRAEPVLFGATPGGYLPPGRQLLGILLAFVPAGFLAGALFQRLAAKAAATGRSLAWAYAVESAGGAMGGLLATFALTAGVSNLAASTAAALTAAAGSFFAGPWAPTSRLKSAAAILCLAALACGLVLSRPLDLATSRWSLPDLVGLRDTPYARLALTQRLGQVAVFQDRALLFETEGTSAEEFVHPSALQVEFPFRVLVLGGGAEGTVAEVLKHGPREVVLVEMDRDFHEGAVAHLPPLARGSFSDPRVRTAFCDPRAYLRDHKGWDLILVGVSEPSTGQANRFFTREFFDMAAKGMNVGGVLAFRLRSAENLWTPLLLGRNASVIGALSNAFGDVFVLPGANDLILASDKTLIRDPEVLSERWRERGIAAKLVCEPYLRYRMTNERTAKLPAMLQGARSPENTDARPVCYPTTAALWLSRFFPGFARWEGWQGGLWEGVPPMAWAGGAALAVGLALVVRRREISRRAALAFAAGFSGMVLESALLLAYQAWHGALYRDLGLLLTLFMVGLACGAAAVGWVMKKGGAAAGVSIATLGVLLCVGSFFALGSGPHPVWWLAGLLAVSGGVTGGLFAVAGVGEAGGRSPGTLYAADLLGGCAGALMGGLLLLPFLGLPASILLLAAVMALCLIWVGS